MIKDSCCTINDIIEKLVELDITNNERYVSVNGLTSGYIFSDVFKSIARYCAQEKCWYIYNGIIWNKCSTEIDLLAKKLVEALIRYASEYNLRTEYREWINKLTIVNSRKNMIKDSTSECIIYLDEFDKNDYLLNTLNCTLDIVNHDVREHRADDLITKCANVEYHDNTECKLFDNFVKDILSGNKEDIRYMQKLFGLCLTGEIKEQEAYILYGSTTRNGKSTLIRVLTELLNTYCVNTDANTFANTIRDTRNASSDLYRLKGARLIVVNEPAKEMKLDAALIKNITGGDLITCRNLYKGEVEFRIHGKIIFCTNYLPVFNDNTVFDSNRIKVIPFYKHYDEDKQDKLLINKLITKESLAGVLRWALNGYIAYSEEGLKNSKSVDEATEQYRTESDKISLFIKEMLVADKSSNILLVDLYDEYVSWCSENDYISKTKKVFKLYLKQKNLLTDRATVNGITKNNVIKEFRIKNNNDLPSV